MQRRNRKIAATMTGVILAVVLLRGCVATSYSIPSSGMENSLYRGEHILVNKWSYGLRLPFMGLWGYHRWAERPVHKEDILVFNNPANLLQATIDRKEVFISRCLGVPGDTLLVDSPFLRNPLGEKCPRPKVPLYLPSKKRKTVGFVAYYSFHPSQRIVRTRYGE